MMRSARLIVFALILAADADPLRAQSETQVGYAVATPDTSTTAAGSALFSFTNSNSVLVSEAGVGSAEMIVSGRIFVDESSATRTGVALVNRSAEAANVTLTLRDAAGVEFGQKPLELGPGGHVARFVDELFTNRPAVFSGSLTFESNRPLAAITLRLTQNTYGEPLYTTLPVVNVAAGAPAGGIVFPHIAAGGGYSTQLILINPSARALRGRVNLVDSDGRALLLRQQGNTVADFVYDIPPHGSYRSELEGLSDVKVGYAAVEPDSGSAAPAGSAIFRFGPGGRLVTEAGVGATRSTTAARIFVDYIGTQTGVAIANRGDLPANVIFTLTDRSGIVIETNSPIALPARSHIARFVHELFPSVADGFSGVLEIRSSIPIIPITLKLTINSRGDLVLTTLPVADMTLAPSNAPLVFPQIALDGGFTTRLILLSAGAATTAGTLAFFNTDGTPLVLPMAGSSGSQVPFRIDGGGARRFFPGNTAAPESISLIDPSSNQLTNEMVVNEGNTVPLRLLVLDKIGAPRDDFDVRVTSLDPSIASLAGSSGVQGRKAGFSTLTMTIGGLIKTATASVVKVDSAPAGFDVAAVAQDPARRLFLTSTETHAILRADSLGQTPQPYAGVAGSAGLRNGVRLESMFKNPGFLALNHADGSLYVSDTANRVIRRVTSGSGGRVSSLAATFISPQGIALDGRGNLWVADAGDHTIRRISLTTGLVEIVAGQPGPPGFADGSRERARFNAPMGIAVEAETAAQEVERLRAGTAPPPITVLVADSGNGVIRRVRETGEVDTIGRLNGFTSPSGVASDSTGNIYLTEPESGRVRIILRTGEVVSAAQAGTFERPRGIVITQNGKAVVTARDRSAREIGYGEPRILNPPSTVRKGQRVTLTGTNFAPDSVVVLAGAVIQDRTIVDTQTITLTIPDLPNGLGILSVQNRGGLAQASVLVDAAPLSELPVGYITTVAGGSTYTGEGGPARAATVNPTALTVDANGNVFVADYENGRVRRIDSRTGTITTVAGTGNPNSALGDGGPAIAAGMTAPVGVLFDSSGNLLIAEGGRIRRVDARTGVITTIVGKDGHYGFCNEQPIDALKACFAYMTGFAIDAEGNLYIGDYYNNLISRVDARTNIMTTIAGNGVSGYSGENIDARNATLSGTYGLAVDDARRALYIAGNGRVRKVDLDSNRITTVAGGGARSGASGDGGSALEAALGPIGLAVDASGNLLIADSGDRVRKVDPATGIITTVAGGGSPADGVGDGGPATTATFDRTWAVAVDGGGNLFVGDSANNGIHYFVRKVDAATQLITTVAGTGQRAALGDNTAAIAATLRGPDGVTVDSSGNMFITDAGNNRIRRIDASTRTITTVAGGGTKLETGVPATDFYFYGVGGRVAVDEAGNLYIAEGVIFRVRKVDARTRTISTVAGNGRAEFSGDGGLAINAGVQPSDLAVDQRGNLFIGESRSRRVRKVDLTTGVITTVAGGGQPASGIGDGGLAVNAVLGSEIRIVSDADGNLFISDTENGRVRRVDVVTGIITTVAGGGSNPCCRNQLATAVSVYPEAVGLDPAGNLLIVDWSYPLQIRRVNAATGISTVIAGGDQPMPNLGDNGPALGANFNYPYAVTSDAAGNIFIADSSNNRIRAVRGPVP